jgi:hypothetical protein
MKYEDDVEYVIFVLQYVIFVLHEDDVKYEDDAYYEDDMENI